MWRPYKLRGRMAGDSQLENNLVYSDGLQSMLTLGGGGGGDPAGCPIYSSRCTISWSWS